MALMGLKWYEVPCQEPLGGIMRCDLDTYPFRQLPKLVDEVNGSIDICQSMVRTCTHQPWYTLVRMPGYSCAHAAVPPLLSMHVANSAELYLRRRSCGI
jgi:hypothetical protein